MMLTGKEIIVESAQVCSMMLAGVFSAGVITAALVITAIGLGKLIMVLV